MAFGEGENFQPWLRHLDACLLSARQGRGDTLFFSSARPDAFRGLIRAWTPDAAVVELSLESASWPYSPFLPALVLLYAPLPAGDLRRRAVERDLLDVKCYFRHTAFLTRVLCGESDAADGEGLLLEETFFERPRLERTLLDLLEVRAPNRALVIACDGAEHLGYESQRLFRDAALLAGRRILVLLGFSGRAKTGADSLVGERQTQGRVFRLADPQGDAPGFPCPVPSHPGKLFSTFLCFRSALAWQKTHETTLEDVLLTAECHFGLQEYEQALFVLQPLILSDEARSALGARLFRLSAWVHLGLDDHTLARNMALQAWKLSPRRAADTETAHTDFLMFHVPGLFADFPEWAAECRERMDDSFAALGWKNHALYLQARNSDVMRIFRDGGAETALERCSNALKLARQLGNARREGVVHHSLAHVLQANGEIPAAEKEYRRAVKLIRAHSRPFEVARVYNGQGYFYLTVGDYRQAFGCHLRALRLLEQSRFHEELLNTLINVARVQLFAGWPTAAREILESVVVAMEQLQLRELPFQNWKTIQAYLGLACLKSGLPLRAEEVLRTMDEVPDVWPSPHGDIYASWLRALVAQTRGQDASDAWTDCHMAVATSPRELRYLRLQVQIDEAAHALTQGRNDRARILAGEAYGLCLAEPLNARERRRLSALEQGGEVASERLPVLAWNPSGLLAAASRDANWRSLQKSLRTAHFLQSWQELLNRERRVPELLQGCRSLVTSHFLVDQVELVESEGPLDDYFRRFGAESRWLDESELPGTPWRGASWLCLESPDGIRHRGFVGSQAGEPYFTPEDHNVLVIAYQHLTTSLVALRQTALLMQSEKMSALGSLVAGIAHEINTPVGIAVTGISFLNQKGAEMTERFQASALTKQELESFLQAGRETGDLVLRNLLRAATLIDSFKRVATDQSNEERRTFSLKEYLEEVLLSLSPKWKKTAVDVSLQGPTGQTLDSYPGALAQVLTNLVVNALTHAFEPGQAGAIRVVVADVPGSEREFFVEDTGRGVPPANLPHLFEPFFTTRRNQGGSGLGLHISYNLVQNVLGGRIRCDSREGHGTRFTVRMPSVAPRLSPGG